MIRVHSHDAGAMLLLMLIPTVQGKFFEASAEDIDPENKLLTVRPPRHQGLSQDPFQIAYDTLILAVGSVNNTFGIQVQSLPGWGKKIWHRASA